MGLITAGLLLKAKMENNWAVLLNDTSLRNYSGLTLLLMSTIFSGLSR